MCVFLFLPQGMAPVRRDTCPLAAECGIETLRAALETPHDDDLLLKPLKKALAELVNPNIPLTRLQKTVAKRPFYKGTGDKLIQKRLFDKIKDRTGVEVDSGTRVPFIITLPRNGLKRTRGKDDKLYLDGEETTYCLDNYISADRDYYVTKQVEAPLLRYLSHTNLCTRIRGMVRTALDTIWVQNTRNTTITQFMRRLQK
jgi:DNA polymerase elongation subunit (family B)